LSQPRFPKLNGRASECACERLLSVPLFHSMTAEQVNCIAAALMKIAGAK
jgi:dTDP-4-amino-4,6-dideoxygalactose transaminase